MRRALLAVSLQEKLSLALRISRLGAIARRYFVTNGFDGALAMLGLLVGFRVGGEVAVRTVAAAGFGTAVALGISGLSSAYISEAAERRQELALLRAAMVESPNQSAHVLAARLAPVIISLVNGLSPFVLAQIILLPLWLSAAGVALSLPAVDLGIGVALGLVFLLGVFLGRISGTFWLWSGLRAAMLALATVGLIMLFGG
jgi:predicted membrane protein (TIGR00267 family)